MTIDTSTLRHAQGRPEQSRGTTSSVSTLSNIERVDDLLKRGVGEVIVEENLEKKLKEGKSLRIKMGFDPTKPDLHLGHAVGLRILKKLQEEGHTIIFVIGDYTTRVGDPSGQNKTRPILSEEEIKENANTYFNQVSKILDTSKAEIRSNSEWFEKLSLGDVIKLVSKLTLAQVIERDDFQKRMKAGNDIGLHELLYPLMQAYDSVVLKADVEFGGTDQKFNMLVGRALQKKMGQAPQDVVTVKLLVGLDGKEKMSKSLGNYIAINDAPNDMYGKVMSIPDDLIVHYYELCTDITPGGLEVIKKELSSPADRGKNPRDIKAELAGLIVETYYSKDEADKAAWEFKKIFSKREKPSEMPIVKLEMRDIRIDDLLMDCKLATSRMQARRLIEQGAVEVSGKKITDPFKTIQIKDKMIVRVGKRNFVKIQKP